MKEVQAITDLHTVETIQREFDGLYGLKVGAVWGMGLQLALRISDLLNVKYEDIQDGRLVTMESKTDKAASIKLNSKALEIVSKLKENNPNDKYLFQSTGNRVSTIKPFSRQYITKCFATVSESLGLEIGTHSMRKTRGYHLYKQTNDITRVMKMLRHSSPSVTLRYIGITQEDIDSDFENLVL